MSIAVRIQDVHKHYRALPALDGVDFSIQQGELFGLLGPNGVGKST
jgi:ABC-type multidrug transport system ATPase subunit